MASTYFIVNPESGKKKSKEIVSLIKAFCESEKLDYVLCITTEPGDVTAYARCAVESQAAAVIVAGGDGTLNEAASVLKGTAIPMGIIPSGTGNDFVRTLGLKTIIGEALTTAVKRPCLRSVDVGSCNGMPFLNIASIGIDAAIVHRTLQIRRWIKGSLIYPLASLIEIFADSPQQVTICIDGAEYRRTIEMVVVANGKYYGGGMKVAPMADPGDGLYDILIVNKMSKLRLLTLLPSLYSGAHIKAPEVEVMRGQSLHIEFTRDVLINRDGELTVDNVMRVAPIRDKISIITNI